jgi:hypothetical protein
MISPRGIATPMPTVANGVRTDGLVEWTRLGALIVRGLGEGEDCLLWHLGFPIVKMVDSFST